jgi:hypothetical protein
MTGPEPPVGEIKQSVILKMSASDGSRFESAQPPAKVPDIVYLYLNLCFRAQWRISDQLIFCGGAEQYRIRSKGTALYHSEDNPGYTRPRRSHY